MPETIVTDNVASEEIIVAPEGEARMDNVTFLSMFMPKSLDAFSGQPDAVKRLKVMIGSAKARGEVCLPAMLFSGESGTGKTTLARIVATEMDSALTLANGPTIKNADDLISIIGSLRKGGTLFIDEIHAMNRKAEEVLYNIMDNPDRKIGYFAIPEFTLICATTLPGDLTKPLRNRMNAEINMKPYNDDSMKSVLRFIVDQVNMDLTDECIDLLPKRSRYVPRNAVQLIKNIYDYAVTIHGINGEVHCDVEDVMSACDVFGVDEYGLNDMDRAYLLFVAKRASEGQFSIGLTNISQGTALDIKTIVQTVEPYMFRLGLVQSCKKGRELTLAGIEAVNKMFADEIYLDINE